MRFSLHIEIGRCGCGFSRGLFPEIRAGIVRVSWYHGSMVDRVVQTLARLARSQRAARALAEIAVSNVPMAPAKTIAEMRQAGLL